MTCPLDAAVAAALEGGELLRRELHRPGGPRGHGHHADVDEEIERVILARLEAAFPEDAFVAEETRPRLPPAAAPNVWFVDPHDGTKQFLRGHRGTSVSIARVSAGRPVLGVVAIPTAPDSAGELIAWSEQRGFVHRGYGPSGRSSPPGVVYVSADASRSVEQNSACVSPMRFRSMPSMATRLALCASGQGAAAVSMASTCAWDYAAGHALCEAAGLSFEERHQGPVLYGSRGEAPTGKFFAAPDPLLAELRQRDWKTVFQHRALPVGRFRWVRLEPGSHVADAGRLRRAQGCILGQLAGDSLGSLVEFQDAESIRRSHPAGVSELANGGTWNLLAGQPTDDSELALMLARSIVEAGRFDAEQAARAYAYWIATSPFDLGHTTRQALGAASVAKQAVASAARAAASRDSQANGSLMRVSPLAIYGWNLEAGELARLAGADSELTHPHVVCRDACGVFCVAIAHAIRTGEPADKVYETALEWCESQNVAEPVRQALSDARGGPPPNFQKSQGWVLIALRNAFHRLLTSGGVREGIEATVACGGDTDTNGAIAGALLGAVHGRESVPLTWRQQVLTCRPLRGLPGVHHSRPTDMWPVDALELAEALLACG